MKRILAAGLCLLTAATVWARSVPLKPLNERDVTVTMTEGLPVGKSAKVWQATGERPALEFEARGTWPSPTKEGAIFVGVSYLDKGYGRVEATLKTEDGRDVKADKFTNRNMTNSGKWVTMLLRFSEVGNGKPKGLRIQKERNEDKTLAIGEVLAQDEAFKDPKFEFLLSEPWKGPYKGKSEPNIDNKTLKGKVMVGYQGWFRTPNDPHGEGWVHWGNIDNGTFNVDMWPDVSQYPAQVLEKAGEVKTLSGKQAYLFSSAWPEVVAKHFEWMKRNNIDGAFLQKFIGGGGYAINGKQEWVLGNVRAAANQYGRIWAIEYDISGCPDDKLYDYLTTDWKWMVDTFGIKTDPAYARENGKPVVFIWGMPFDNRNISVATADKVVDFFKNDPKYGGNYVIGGIPGQWRRMGEWQDHFKKFDSLLAWMSTSYKEDVADFKAMGIDYYPHVKPGFSWANLKHIPTGSKQAFTPRENGKHYRGQFEKAAEAGADRLFVGMYDEYDESTAIIPMSDDPPPTPVRKGTVAKFYKGNRAGENAVTISRPQVEFKLDGQPPVGDRGGHGGIPAEDFFMRWEGSIIPPATGEYVFDVEGAPGDGVELFINDKKVMENPSLGTTPTEGAKVQLTKGEMIFYRVDCKHYAGQGDFRLVWSGPGIEKQTVPADVLVDAWGRFITNEGQPADLYLKLTNEARELIRKNP